jgi:hypothetical protein
LNRSSRDDYAGAVHGRANPQVALALHHSMAAGHFAAERRMAVERHISRWGARMAAAQAATTAQVPDIFCGKLDTPP